MKYEVMTLQDHMRLVERMAAKPFRKPYVIDVHFTDGRSTDQNAMMWGLLTDISRQVMWPDQLRSPSDWKWIFTAALKGQHMAPGIDGSIVVLGSSTSRMSKREMTELIESILAFGVEHDVQFTETGEINDRI